MSPYLLLASSSVHLEQKSLSVLKVILKSSMKKRKTSAKSTRLLKKSWYAGGTNAKSVMKDLSCVLEKRITEYREALKQADLGEQFNPGPWLVAKDVERLIYDAWSHTVPAVWKVAYKETGGLVLFFGDPYPVHGVASSWFLAEIPLKLDRIGGEALRRAFLYPSESGFDIPGYGNKVPDFAMKPRFQHGLRLPSLAVEVGYHGEGSFEEIRQETRLWSSAGCGIAIGLKISDQTAETSGDPRLQLVVIAGGRSSNEEIIEFGHGSQCVSAGTHILNLPLALLTRHARPLPLVTPGAAISLDLYYLRQDIVDQLMN